MSDTATGEPHDSWYLLRPPQTLQSLPYEYRWEVVRRHPYDHSHWQAAQQLHDGKLKDEVDRAFGEVAVTVLLNLGVNGKPPPPNATFEELEGGQLAAAWRDGAVAPVTFRGLAMTILGGLPPATLGVLGQVLLDSGAAGSGDDEEATRARFAVAQRLARADAPGLDALSTRPMLAVNVHAPQRAIVDAVEQEVRRWKEQAGLPEVRRRPELLAPNLAAWDLREGWVDFRYDVDRERTFAQIATELGLSRRTAANRYAAAFEMVSGHPYTLGNWVRLFYFAKLSGGHAIQAMRRRSVIVPDRVARSVDAVNESTLAGGCEVRDGGPLAREASDGGSQAHDVELMLDAVGWAESGLDEDAIAEKLELHLLGTGCEVVRTILDRHREGRT